MFRLDPSFFVKYSSFCYFAQRRHSFLPIFLSPFRLLQDISLLSIEIGQALCSFPELDAVDDLLHEADGERSSRQQERPGQLMFQECEE